MPTASHKRILITGGAGFIGSAITRRLLQSMDCQILNLDKLTYAANISTLNQFRDNPLYQFIQADICDDKACRQAIEAFEPEAIIHAAAETHVDRSIAGAADFVQTNILGTFNLLEATREYWRRLKPLHRTSFRFLHVSTDEVYGSLGPTGAFTESTRFDPRSPYSASKASSDHLVMAWHHTHGLPVLLTHCSNNYGPFQFPEKLVPRMILCAVAEQPLPLYGDGSNVRDWLHVDDHAEAVLLVLRDGLIGQTYNIGDCNERTNLQVVRFICQALDQLRPRPAGDHTELITFVQDRPGHDLRYAIDASKIREELGWQASTDFESGLRETVEWYLKNPSWAVDTGRC